MKLKPILCFTGGALGTIVLGVLAFLFVLDKPVYTKWMRAQTEMGEVQKALNLYALAHDNRYPDKLDALQEDYFKSGVPKNPFTKQPYCYLKGDGGFALVCYGHDDQPGGKQDQDQDIVLTEMGYLKTGS